MAASFNKVLLMGNLTRDPELRYLPSGQPVATFSVAVNRTYTSQTGEKKEEVNFVRIVVWARLAELCNEYLKKGSPVFVEGRLQTRSWEAQDGSKRSTTEVVAQTVQFLSSRGGGQRGENPSANIDLPSDNGINVDEAGGFSATTKSKKHGTGGEDLQPDDEIPF